mgnify:CR=1 FL=1
MENTAVAKPKHSIVTGLHGRRGHLEGAALPQPGEPVTVIWDDGSRALVPGELLSRQADGSYHLPIDPKASQGHPGDAATVEKTVVPVVEEQLHVAKRERETEQVVVHITPHERQETIRQPVVQEHVEVERVAVDRIVDQPESVRQEGDVTIVPIMEEVLVVEKRLRVKEELRIRRRRETAEHTQSVSVRSEEARVLRSGKPQTD